MRLLTKTSLLIITVSIFIFMTGNIVFFNVSKQMIGKHVDTELVYQMHNVIKQLRTSGPESKVFSVQNDVIIKPIGNVKTMNPHFTDTVLFNDIQEKFIPHRALNFTFPSENKNYQVTIFKSLLSSDKLIERITISSILMVLSFVIMIYIMNQYVFGSVWSNFFANLKNVEDYDIKGTEKLVLEESEIDEFNKLNLVLADMVNRIQHDFINLKELTANTSHEIQTPLAIIKSKAEILLQSSNLNEEELNSIASIINTTGRLSKLNQSLLLITKIENNQFGDSETIIIQEIIQKLVANFEMLWQAGNYKMTEELGELSVFANPVLIDVMISNLVKNAIIHGAKGGEIIISIVGNVIYVKNSGEQVKFDSEDIFNRFVKGSVDKLSSGMGLAIVKKICDYYGLPISYQYEDDKHCFSIDCEKIAIKKDITTNFVGKHI